MACEALSMYLLFVKPLEAFDQNQFLKRCTFICLLSPAIILTTTAAIKPDDMISEEFCLVRGHAFYYGVLTPIVLILMFNMVVVICCIRSLWLPTMAAKKTSLWKQCRITMTMSMLLGGTWLFAFFAVGKATVPFQIVFTIMTTLQGFFIFVLFVLLKKEVRGSLCKEFIKLHVSKCNGCLLKGGEDMESDVFKKSPKNTLSPIMPSETNRSDSLTRTTILSSVSD